MLQGKKIILGVTGSIAAYKAATLIRLLSKEGAEIQVVMTKAAVDFITPLTLSTLSHRPVLIEPFHPASGEWYSHVDWANWADLILIAPLTANTMAKMATGQADNLLMAIYLASRCPVYFAPAMDVDMYMHPVTQGNINKLTSLGHVLIPPDEGHLASGLIGKGRMKEPEEIVGFLKKLLKKKNLLTGKKILITAGPTYEKIDPVRFIGNFSTGKMGFALADTLAEMGAAVTLLTGPTAQYTLNRAVKRIDVVSAAEMNRHCLDFFPDMDITIMAAAVADYTIENPASVKIKKDKKKHLLLDLVPTPDILSNLGKIKASHQLLVGFALETDRETQHAMDKLKNKNLDLIVLNSLRDEGAGFGHDTNKVSIFGPK
ncbi:MAG: bifunctional phosphopantothenoylcysteine decarboxylase/phosphopantothenate--cysteine ligase CoaBC, partial [Bacteroidetes bacterium]|nr:bifunctional phosphopantothenoylcysteine decarboxylase/phosphopantothenate--cysteine ligase CoaBC [Bacteroidota bacterium]